MAIAIIDQEKFLTAWRSTEVLLKFLKPVENTSVAIQALLLAKFLRPSSSRFIFIMSPWVRNVLLLQRTFYVSFFRYVSISSRSATTA